MEIIETRFPECERLHSALQAAGLHPAQRICTKTAPVQYARGLKRDLRHAVVGAIMPGAIRR